MSNHALALQEIEKFYRAFKAFEEAKNALTSLASVEQNLKEVTAQRDKVIKELEEESIKLQDYRKNAVEQKNRISEESKKTLEKLKDKQDKEIKNLTDEYEAMKKSYIDSLDNIQGKIVFETQVFQDLQIEIKEKEKEIASLETRVAEVRKQINKLLS
jgi:chromosome segregation ATPase